MQKISKIVGLSFEGGGGENFFSKPNISPIFGLRGLKFFVPFSRPNFILNFKTLPLKLGRGETIVEIKKFAFFGKMGIFQI